MDAILILFALGVVGYLIYQHTESQKPATQADLKRLTAALRSHSHTSNAESAIEELRTDLAGMRNNIAAMRNNIAAMRARLDAIEIQQGDTD